MITRLCRALRGRRCFCDAVRLHGRCVEMAGVKHRRDGPCYHCDIYGEAL